METWRAVATTCAVKGVRRRVSHTTRRGSLQPGRRQVGDGSSASTVPTPAMMADSRWRWAWTWALACSPVIHRDAPVWAAILPSMVMAYFITTKGRPVRM